MYDLNLTHPQLGERVLRQKAAYPDEMGVICSHCGAPVGEVCRNSSGQVTHLLHFGSRIDFAVWANRMGLPGVTSRAVQKEAVNDLINDGEDMMPEGSMKQQKMSRAANILVDEHEQMITQYEERAPTCELDSRVLKPE